MNKIQLPQNWADLVEKSRRIVTEERFNLAKTWIFPEADSGDNASIPKPSPILKQAGNFGTNDTPTTVYTVSPTSNILASSQSRLPVSRGDNAPSSNNYIEAPKMINLETSVLIQSKWINNLINPTNANNDGPAIMVYTSSVKNESPFDRPKHKRPILAFFSIFFSVGALWIFATSLSPHFHNKDCHSFITRVSNDYERINGIFNDTMKKSIPPSQIFYNFKRSLHLQADVERKLLQGLLPGYVRANRGPR